MSNQMIMYLMIGAGVAFAFVLIAYLVMRKIMNKSEYKNIQKLREGTKASGFSMEILLQKLYMQYVKIPLLKRYTLKARRRLEIINMDDEYLTRKQTAMIISKSLLIVIPVAIFIIIFTHTDLLLMSILLLMEIFLVETILEGMVDKIDNRLLKQQIDFFAQIRHAYHEYNMVGEAIYETAQDNELEVSRQAEKIYEILMSDDPETELEKYYDIAPNIYLKEFAGVSYLTQEFGDRKIDGASVYLKNLNNITQEMQLEILKRDKLDYVFQSLSVIAAAPMLFISPVKNWAVSQFSFTTQFYDGKGGLAVQFLLIIISFICYMLVRTLKDNGKNDGREVTTENPWQAKLYKIPIIKKFVDLFIPKPGSKEYRKIRDLLKDAASKNKMEWLYINRICICIAAFILSLFFFFQMHKVSIDYIYNQPTSDYDIVGQMSESDEKKAMDLTKQDNYFLNMFKNKPKTTKAQISIALQYSEYYEEATEEEITTATDRIYQKLQVIQSEYLKWFEILLSFVFGIAGYYGPVLLLIFQVKMRQLEMENEVMQFQTIILMLMKIERVNVEIILEWIERYSNIFREPISKCLNNYESGAWEALEQLKDDVSYEPFIRIVESLQAAVEKIPIADAFDELETEREYYQEKRKESNERLISKKGMIGRAIGFAPMVCLFVGYLIVPLVVIGMMSMTQSFTTMSTMTK